MIWVPLKEASFKRPVLYILEGCFLFLLEICQKKGENNHHKNSRNEHTSSQACFRISFILHFTFTREKKAKKLEDSSLHHTVTNPSLKRVHGRN